MNLIDFEILPPGPKPGPINRVNLIGTAKEFRQLALDLWQLCYDNIPDDFLMMLDLSYNAPLPIVQPERENAELSTAK